MRVVQDTDKGKGIWKSDNYLHHMIALTCSTKFEAQSCFAALNRNTATKLSRRSDSGTLGVSQQLLAGFEILPQHTENINLSLQFFLGHAKNVDEQTERKDHAKEREWKRHLDVSDLSEVLISVPLPPARPSSGNSKCFSALARLVKVRVGETEAQNLLWRCVGEFGGVKRYHCTKRLSKKHKTKTATPTSLSQHPSLTLNQKYLATFPLSPPVLRGGEWRTHTNTHTHMHTHVCTLWAKPKNLLELRCVVVAGRGTQCC